LAPASNVKPQKPPNPNTLEKELSIEDTDAARARIGSPVHADAAYVRHVVKPTGKPTSTGDLRTLSQWIAKQREIAELKGESVRVRTKRKR